MNFIVKTGVFLYNRGTVGVSCIASSKVLYQEDEDNIIGQYIIFCKVYNEQRKKYGQTKKAVTETILICKSRNVLKEYLESKEQEVKALPARLGHYDDIV